MYKVFCLKLHSYLYAMITYTYMYFSTEALFSVKFLLQPVHLFHSSILLPTKLYFAIYI